MAELIDLPFGLWTGVGQTKHKFSHIRSHGPLLRAKFHPYQCNLFLLRGEKKLKIGL